VRLMMLCLGGGSGTMVCLVPGGHQAQGYRLFVAFGAHGGQAIVMRLTNIWFWTGLALL